MLHFCTINVVQRCFVGGTLTVVIVEDAWNCRPTKNPVAHILQGGSDTWVVVKGFTFPFEGGISAVIGEPAVAKTHHIRPTAIIIIGIAVR